MVRRWGGAIEESAQLLDAKRSGRPLLFTESVCLRLIAFYCQCPMPGCRSWSVRWAAHYFNEHIEIIGRTGCATFCTSRILCSSPRWSASWNEHFAHLFRWTYKGEGLAEKVVCRLTEWLLLQHKQMKRGFLHKQLLLISNLVRDYWPEVSLKRWQDLYKALADSGDYLQQIIDGCRKTQQALAVLLDELKAKIQSRCCCAERLAGP